ncbi:RNA methyltransferase, putative [Talaromyces stipitatus ATCC 10500]|uniref:rRNA methyltransferase 1, mitochondrial n=1 Tax=Talaromyces stipitatus (strain ATCC 10500 / CBS 375.48 / QM 6759 / NRRL 1006) TaxID=441959 RepID=B8M9F0_TALSN|nr:RNA methyltransferase, putative [Talaromyces stipitatus ATCC 10500]EED17710.1 RNA methyltransferase, putative [Talaromyces stipitatus ATCC 10500]
MLINAGSRNAYRKIVDPRGTMITTLTHRSLRLCHRVNFASEVILRNNCLPGTRNASLTSNIARAARKSAAIDASRQKYDRSLKDDRRSTASSFREDPRNNRPSYDRDTPAKRRSNKDEKRDYTLNWLNRGRVSKSSGEGYVNSHKKLGKGSGNIKRRRGKDHEPTDAVPERIKTNVPVPATIPYTTPASEFIYGLSAVDAAIRCTRRKLYMLYIYQAVGEELSPEKIALRKLALARGIQVKMAFAGWDKLLDKMSAGRPHNGVILEASPMPQIPVTSLRPVPSPIDDFFEVGLDKQSVEEAEVNGSSNRIARVERFEEVEKSRFPLVILLDGILDPGNMGAVIRSAYYLGVDALVLTGRNSAPLTPVTIKASAGAAENMTIFKAKSEIDFIRRSRENGWRFYAADSPQNVSDLAATHGTLADYTATVAANGSSPSASLLTSAPTVLMLGNEGTGLLPRIKAQADGYVSIPGARIRPDLGINDAARVDSLNVSVAAALLMEMFMRVPLRVASAVPVSWTGSEKATEDTTPPKSFDFD